MTTNAGSILNDVKDTLGLASDYTPFDAELITHINSGLSRLTQLGVGPELSFEVVDDAQIWSQFMGTDMRLASAKSYLHLYVKLLFDPPEVGFVLNAMKEQMDKLEWTLNVVREDRDNPAPITPGVLPNEGDVIILDGGTT